MATFSKVLGLTVAAAQSTLAAGHQMPADAMTNTADQSPHQSKAAQSELARIEARRRVIHHSLTCPPKAIICDHRVKETQQ